MVSFHRSADVATDQTVDEGVTLSLPSEHAGAAAFPRVNLMPDIVAAEARTHRAKLVLVGAATASILVVGGLYLMAAGTVSAAQDQLDQAQARSASLATEAAKYADVPAVQAQVQNAQAQTYQAMGGEVRWSFLLNNLALTIPPGTTLNTFTGTVNPNPPTTSTAALPASVASSPFVSVLGHPGVGTITYAGAAMGYPNVANFLDAQAKQATLLDPYVTSVIAGATGETGSDKGVTFSSSATVTATALSHRYDAKAGS